MNQLVSAITGEKIKISKTQGAALAVLLLLELEGRSAIYQSDSLKAFGVTEKTMAALLRKIHLDGMANRIRLAGKVGYEISDLPGLCVYALTCAYEWPGFLRHLMIKKAEPNLKRMGIIWQSMSLSEGEGL